MAGVMIGEGALVAAGSVVTKSVEPHTVVGGILRDIFVPRMSFMSEIKNSVSDAD